MIGYSGLVALGTEIHAWVERRRNARQPADFAGRIIVEGREPIECWIVDISAGGARLSVKDAGALPESFVLETRRGPRSSRMAWRSNHEIGVSFDDWPPAI
jgi:hypothetical protein